MSTSNVIDLFSAFATDTNAEEQGTYTVLPGCGDTEFLIARENNPTYNRLLTKLLKQNKVKLDSKGPEAEKVAEGLMVEVMSKSVLLGWKGNILFKGVETTYSRDAAVQLLQIKDFRNKVSEVARDMETFRAVKEAEDEKN